MSHIQRQTRLPLSVTSNHFSRTRRKSHRQQMCEYRCVRVPAGMCVWGCGRSFVCAWQYVCENGWECVIVWCLNQSSWCPSGPGGIRGAEGVFETKREWVCCDLMGSGRRVGGRVLRSRGVKRLESHSGPSPSDIFLFKKKINKSIKSSCFSNNTSSFFCDWIKLLYGGPKVTYK